jgi:thiol-disulfide isomerase/thioredoxin
MKIMKTLALIFTVLVITVQASAQKQGFNIRITLDDYNDSVLYLVNYYGKTNQIKDTAYSKNGNFVFKGKKSLPGGIYLAVTGERKYFEMLVDKEQHFSIHTKNGDFVNSAKIKGSKDNQDFYEYLKFLEKKDKERKDLEAEYKNKLEDENAKKEMEEKLKKINDDVLAYKDNIIKTMPESFLATILKASKEPEIPTELPKKEDGTPDSSYIYKYYKQHFFDGFDFADERLLRTPIYAARLKKYFTQVLLQHPDTLIKEADEIIAKAKPDSETYKYCIWYFTYETETSQIMGLDAVFVHLVKKYYETGEAYWVNDAVLKNITERANTLDRLLIGKTAPNMIMIDTTNDVSRLVALWGVQANYTVVLFWDPDCGHCRHEIPLIRDWMKENADKYGIKVFAVCSDTNLVKWKNFLREYNITDWVNVNGTRSATENYHDLYDIISTPTIYVLDKDKKILAKRLGYEQLKSFIKRDYEKNHKKEKPKE